MAAWTQIPHTHFLHFVSVQDLQDVFWCNEPLD